MDAIHENIEDRCPYCGQSTGYSAAALSKPTHEMTPDWLNFPFRFLESLKDSMDVLFFNRIGVTLCKNCGKAVAFRQPEPYEFEFAKSSDECEEWLQERKQASIRGMAITGFAAIALQVVLFAVGYAFRSM